MRTVAISVLVTLLAIAGWAAPASATAPSIPTSVHVSATTATSFTVALARSSNATSYQVFYGLTKDDLTVAKINSHTKSITSSKPTITVSHLAYTTSTYWYRVKAHNGKTAYKWGTAILAVGLTPPTPTGFAGLLHSANSLGAYLYWTSERTSHGFVVTQATDSAMTKNVVTRSITGSDYQYAPAGLSLGTTYYFRIRARNLNTLSASSKVVSFTARAHQGAIKVLTYNVLDDRFSGQSESGNTVAPWSSRRTVVAKNILQAGPDVAGIQEAGSFIGTPAGFGGTRQIDDLLELLPGYALARTEVPPTEHGYERFGNYVIYKTATLETAGTGGHWDIGDTTSAAYQEFEVIATGAKFLFTTPHLMATTGATADKQREAETTAMLKDAAAVAAVDHVRVIYGGDFNSDPVPALHAFDGPGIAMGSAAYRSNDTETVATSLTNAQYNSSNQYLRTPPAFGDDIDKIYVGPGIPVESWGMIVNVTGGKFVGTIGSDHNPVWAVVTIPS